MNCERSERLCAAGELENVVSTGSEADCFEDRGTMENITSDETFNITLLWIYEWKWMFFLPASASFNSVNRDVSDATSSDDVHYHKNFNFSHYVKFLL